MNEFDAAAFRLMQAEDEKRRQKGKSPLYEEYTSNPPDFYFYHGQPIHSLTIDIETFSEAELSKTGVYKYAENPSFEILLFGFSVDNGPVSVVDLTQGERIPIPVLAALLDETIIKSAFNAQFERICLSRYLHDIGLLPDGDFLNPRGWHCDMVWSGYMGFPMSLKNAGKALHLDEQKMEEGKELITYFCKPYRPTSVNEMGDRNLPRHRPIDWLLFKIYNKRDVEVEMEIAHKLRNHPVPEQVWEEYWLDQTINDRGILIDIDMVESAIDIDRESGLHLKEEMQQITKLANPQSVMQMQRWLRENGVELDSLGKKALEKKLAGIAEPMKSVLIMRQQLAMSAVKKYKAMESAVCKDGRLRGMFKFYGANRSGRFSGSIVQLQNLFRNSLHDLDVARDLVREGDYDALFSLYDSIPEVLAQCVRTAFIPAPGYKFIVADFSAIEARVLAWLAGEQWVLDVFQAGGDIYCETASRMFHVPVEKHGQNADLRQKGKQAVLSCGYGGSVGALEKMGAIEAGMKQEELQPLVNAWRQANPKIVKLWYAVDKAVKQAIKEKATTTTHGLVFTYRGGMLYITLPSGRQLSYVRPRIGQNRFGGESINYEGNDFARHWSRVDTFGGKLVENCLAEGTLVVTDKGLIPIEDVTTKMRVWDGQEFVQHDGLLRKGVCDVICVNGIYMTPNHKILTEKGWLECGKSEGFNWADVRLPNNYRPFRNWKMERSPLGCHVRMWKHHKRISVRFNKKTVSSTLLRLSAKKPLTRFNRTDISLSHGSGESRKQCSRKTAMALPVYMRKTNRCINLGFAGQKIPDKILRMHEESVDQRSSKEPWYESSSCLECLAQHETKMFKSKASRISKLWWTRNYSLRSLVGKFREFLGRYGLNVAKGVRYRSYRQQQGLQPGKLPLGRSKNEFFKSQNNKSNRNALVETSCINSFGINRYSKIDTTLQAESWLASRVSIQAAQCQKSVYDIMNAGPRHCFAVWNGERAFIVSNCVQAISRDILCHAMNLLREMRICAHVHDELIIETPLETTVEEICRIMATVPSWASGLILAADGYECSFYQKS